MVHKRVDGELVLEDVRLIFRNFAGEARTYNEEGKRNFGIALPEEMALELRDIGWKIKDNSAKVARGDADEVLYHMPVTVKFGRRPPKMFLITKSLNQRTPLDEDTAMILDVAEFETVDVIIRPFNWDVNGQQGVAAYLKTIFAVLREDELEMKYADVPIENQRPELESYIDAQAESDTGWVEDDDQLALPSGSN